MSRQGASRSLLSRRLEADESPVTRVVKLLEEMKAQVESEAKEDEEVYDKMGCWCQTNDKEKTAAIKTAEARIEALTSTIEEGTARAAKLGSEIEGLKEDIAENQDAIDKASALREKEKAEFEDTDKDLTESIGALKQAVEVLKKVQLVQSNAGRQPTAESMMQVKALVSRASKSAAKHTLVDSLDSGNVGIFKSVMQKDLWDLLSMFPTPQGARVITGLEQQPMGQAAGASSYSAQSSSIFGMLQQMEETFSKNLAAAQKEEIQAELAFQRLRSAKEGEMQAAAKNMEEKTSEKADTEAKVAEAKQDLEDTRNALSSDEKFLMDLKKRCATADSDYATRQKTRQDEIAAIAETIKILTEDDARDLFSKSLSLLQTRAVRGAGALALSEAAMQRQQHAVSQLLAVARRHRNTAGGFRLATLAVNVQLDGFTKVKEMMDKMVVELKKQQQDEYDKHELCKQQIDENEDATRASQSEKKDLEAQIAGLEGTVAALTKELEELATKTKETHVSLKSASEERKAENKEFQQVVADQRATAAILTKALERLRDFYGKESLLAVGAKAGRRQEPGAAVAPPPPAGKDYSENGMSAGVMQMLEKVIQDAKQADAEAMQAEQASQEAYGELVANINAVLDATATATTEKTMAKSKAESDMLLAKKDLASTEATLKDLDDQNKALHMDCDYLLKNFNIRQQARQEEIESIQEAKAILSGADFGF